MALSLPVLQAAINQAIDAKTIPAEQQTVVDNLKQLIADKSLDPNTSWLPFKNLFDAIQAFPAGDTKKALLEIYNQHIPAYVAALEEALAQATAMPAQLDTMMQEFQNSDLGKQIQQQMQDTMGRLAGAMPNLGLPGNAEAASEDIDDMLPSDAQPQSEQEMLVMMAKLLNEQSTKFYTELATSLGENEAYKELRRMLKEYLYLQKRVDSAISKVLGDKHI